MSDKGKSLRLFSPETALIRGRDAYASGRHKKAVDYFTSIINSCDCNRRERRRICRCKDFLSVAQNGGSIFHEAMYNCKCDVSLKWDKCHDQYHIRALDYRAAAFEKEDVRLAKRDAEWLLEMAPRALEGYLRLGKIYRIEKKPKVALALWNAGIEVGRKEGLGGSRKMKQLHEVRQPLQMHYARVDPMSLPVELLEEILSYLQLTELCRVQGVCKRWYKFLDSRPFVWRHIEFPARPKKPPPSVWTKKLAMRMRGTASSLVIPCSVQEKLTKTQWLHLANAAQQARRLDLNFFLGTIPPLPPDRRFASQLASLKIVFPKNRLAALGQRQHDFLDGILTQCHSRLESLWLGQATVFLKSHLVLPRLRYLRLHYPPAQASLPHFDLSGHISLPELARITPCLEQIYFEGLFSISCDFDGDSLNALDVRLYESAWPNLRVFISDGDIMYHFAKERASNDLVNNPRPPSLPPFFKQLRVFESRGSSRFSQPGLLSNTQMDDCAGLFPRLPVSSMDYMERYWVETKPLNFFSAERLRPPLQAGKLYELGLAFPNRFSSDMGWGSGPLPAQAFLQYFPCLYGAPGVRVLGLFHFNLDSNLTIPDFLQSHLAHRPATERDQAALLINFIESFPQLETLVLGSEYCDAREVAALAEAVANRGKVKKFYLKGVTGQVFLQIRELAAMKGAEVMFWKGKTPWPYPLVPHPGGP